MDVERGDAVVAVGEHRPGIRLRGASGGREPQLVFVLHAVDGHQRRNRRGRNEHEHRRLVRREGGPVAGERAVERRRIGFQVPGDEAGVAVFLRAGIGGLEQLHSDEIERLRIVAPRRRAVLRAVDGAGDGVAAGRVVDGDRGVFRTAGGEADGDLGAIRRGQDVVDGVGLAAVIGHHLGDVDDSARALGVAHDEVVIVGAGVALLEEFAAVIDRIALDEAEAAGEGADPLAQVGAARDRIQDRGSVGALRLHPVDGGGIELFHAAIAVGDRFAPQRLGDGGGRDIGRL